MLDLRRRDFVSLLGGAAVGWPLAAQAQQPQMPVIGILSLLSPEFTSERLRGFRQGLKESGYVEGENVVSEYRWAGNQVDRLPSLAAELVHRQVAVIVAFGGRAPTMAAKGATLTIPIVFGVGEDPVKLGLVTSLARPGTNMTGLNFFNLELGAKRLELLCELVPGAKRIAAIVGPTGPGDASDSTVRDVETAARSMGLQVNFFHADSSQGIDAAFTALAREQMHALFVGGGAFFTNRRVQLVSWAMRYALPATYAIRDYCEAGGLMSYGGSTVDAYRQMGVYAGRILKGAKPADLPVVQPSKFELVINAQTAKILGLAVPPSLIARADEVIE
jgi:putative tryptophan/tyrosine transport system substrate-binding protein